MSSSAVVVLFYRYFLPTSPSEKLDEPTVDEATLQFFQTHSSYYLPLLHKHQNDLCEKLGNLKGRILISHEGINGTLSCPSTNELGEYRKEMETFDLMRDLGVPPILNDGEHDNSDARDIPRAGGGRFFANIDWKTSTTNRHKNNKQSEPFPDLKIQIVKEIVNTGGLIHVKDIQSNAGKEISPKEFHQILMEAEQNDGGVMTSSGGAGDNDVTKATQKEVVIIDVRNTFEHSIGHFLHPHSNTISPNNDPSGTPDTQAQTNANKNNLQPQTTQPSKNNPPTPALNPNTVTFSHFDSTFCSQYSDALKDKKVLMYCTGGIRCIKASAMLKQRGVEDVSHLSGGIHRYVEQYGNSGFYKGKVFVFDQRVALDPDSMVTCNTNDGDEVDAKEESNKGEDTVVGKCLECQAPHDQISGATVCTVCRDLILLCPTCKSSMSEYHCHRHSLWKNSYFTFLERFSVEELQTQHGELQTLHDVTYVPVKEHKNVRRTLRKQMDKILARIKVLNDGTAMVETNAKRRCRTCFESEEVCDGLCWGFWRSLQSPYLTKNEDDGKLEPIFDIKVGDRVTPGPNWNTLRLGSRCYLAPASGSRKKRRRSDDADGHVQSQSASSNNDENRKVGTVVEMKSWASGVAVLWDQSATPQGEKNESKDNVVAIRQSDIYRWGAVARNGKRMYDVRLIS